MTATPESGFLVIADLTGYTAYLSGSEIEHAPAIAGDLLINAGDSPSVEMAGGRSEPSRLLRPDGGAAGRGLPGLHRRRVP